MTLHYATVISGLVAATILGLYGQTLSYFLNELFPIIGVKTTITITTFISIGLYIIIPIFLFLSKKYNKDSFAIYIILCGILGISISIWSFFVWAGWMVF